MKKYYEIKSEARVLEDGIFLNDVKGAMNFLEEVKQFINDGWYTFDIVIEGKERMTTKELTYDQFKTILDYDYLQEIL